LELKLHFKYLIILSREAAGFRILRKRIKEEEKCADLPEEKTKGDIEGF
jgi:hypothetical protein